MVANCRVKMTRSFWEMPPSPGILSEIWMGFFLIFTFVSAIARRRCCTEASSAASTSPFFTSPVLVFPSQTQIGSFGAALAFGAVFAAVAGAVAIAVSSYRAWTGRLTPGLTPEASMVRSSSGSELRPSPSSSVIRPRWMSDASDWLKVCMPNFDWPTCICE